MRFPSNAVAIVASGSGAGKTSLMVALISLLKKKGYLVGSVKHSAHEVDMDREGSDSWRFGKAGSDVTVLATSKQVVVMRKPGNSDLENILRELSTGNDIVLVEGYKEMELPKIEVYRGEHSDTLYCRNEDNKDQNLVAVASDIPMECDVPVLDLNDPEEVCEFIVKRFISVLDA